MAGKIACSGEVQRNIVKAIEAACADKGKASVSFYEIGAYMPNGRVNRNTLDSVARRGIVHSVVCNHDSRKKTLYSVPRRGKNKWITRKWTKEALAE